jgi:hypothetical protein
MGPLVLFGNTNDRPRSGRLRVTIARQGRLMRLTHLRNQTRTAVETRLQIRGSWRLSHCMHASRRRGVSGFPTCGRYALIPNSLSLLRTV